MSVLLGDIKTQPGWQNSWLASVVTVLKTVIYRCSVKIRIRKPYLTATVNRISVIRYWPHGENWDGIISTCYLNWKTAELDAFVDITPDNLLHRIQADILELESHAVAGVNLEEYSRSDNKRLLDPEDNSLSFHVCHSPQREVEILHDRLLAMLEADPTLTPRDIIVMVADIDSYSPFIRAVFGSAPTERYLPYAISDRRARQSHPVLQAFISLLSLPDSRFVSEDVLALLDVPVLAARFTINEEGLRYLRLWVNESGIRWGLTMTTCASWNFLPRGSIHGNLA